MPDPTPTTDAVPARRRRSGRADVVYWFVVGVIYIGLGIAAPPLFLLGFQESALYVFLAIVLQPRILRRFR